MLSTEERLAIEHIASSQNNMNGRRASALIALSDGQSHAQVAEETGLTEGQVKYAVRKFNQYGLGAFTESTTNEQTGEPSLGETEQLRQMVAELNTRVAELQALVDAQGTQPDNSAYPLRLLTMVRDNIQKLTPDMQLDVLRNFQGMSTEDLLDIDTWKGLAYMMTYSARFQAGQARDRVANTINQVVPEPIQPARLWGLGKKGLDRITPDIAKQILSTFEGASRQDLFDLDTWKGIAYMINYSLQFQAEQLKLRLTGGKESDN